MRIRTGKRGFGLIELVVVIVALVVLASIIYPIFARPRGARQDSCNSNVRQLALAIQMYSQDNQSRLPGIDGNATWPTKIAPYLGSSSAMFMCPSDKTADSGINSFAMAGILIRQDGAGVKESQIISPSEVGAVCDAVPSVAYPEGRLIGGGGAQPIEKVGATIATRHSKGVIVGFCDGHAKYFQGAINLLDEGNGAVRALYHAAPLGLIDNPVGCLPSGCGIPGLKGRVTVGGEYATYPFLMAAAKMHGDYYTAGFRGQSYRKGRPKSGWVWGTACAGPEQVALTAMAYDAVCVIVSKGSKIPQLPSLSNSTYALSPSAIRALFQIGYQKDTVQVYHLPSAYCSTNAYVKQVIGHKSWGVDSIEVANDAEMVWKVANDPWAIGYCSSAFADPDRVVVLAPVIRGKTYVWPRASTRFRWVMPTMKASDWPWKRSLDVVNSNDKLGTGIAATLRTGDLMKQGLSQGPLFTWGYWAGNY